MRAAAGTSDGFAQIIDQQGDPVGDPAFGAPTFGSTWIADDELNPFDLTDGRAPEADGEIVIDRKSAKDTGYQVGDIGAPCSRPEGVDSFELVGIVRFGTTDSPGGASYVMWTEAAASAWSARRAASRRSRWRPKTVSPSSRWPTRSTRRSRPMDASGVEVVTGTEITEETQSDIKQSLSFITTFFLRVRR